MADKRRPQDKWRQNPQPGAPAGSAAAPRGPARRKNRFGVLVAFVALAGVALGLSTFVGCAKPPVLVSIAVTEYTRYDWPVNPWAEQDAAGLRRHFPQDSAHARQSQTRSAILSELAQAADLSRGQHEGRPIVVHFSALGVVRDGEVYALPADAEPGQPTTWLRLDDLLKPIREAKGKRLFLLDLRPVVDARLGLLNDDLFDALNDKLRRMDESGDLSFSVVASGSPGSQTCWSGELGRSAFGWFLERGLAGVADKWNDDKKVDRRIAAPELAAYARQATATFTKDLNQPLQVPARYGKDDNFELLALERRDVPEAAKPQLLAEYPPWLLAGWQERDLWRAKGDHVRLQRSFRQFESYLLRAEQRWLGGRDAELIQTEWTNDLNELRTFRARHPEQLPPARSLALVRAEYQRQSTEALAAFDKQCQEAQDQLGSLLTEIRALPSKIDDAEKQKIRAKIEDNRKALREKPPLREPAAAVLCDAATGATEWSREQRWQLSLTLRDLNAPAWAEVTMIHFVAALDDNLLERWERHKGLFALLHDVVRKAEVAAACDARASSWIAAELKSVDDLRRQALVDLLQGMQKQRETAMLGLIECAKKYEQIAIAAAGIGRAWNEFDETRLFLAEWASFLAPDGSKQLQLSDDWAVLVGGCRELARHLKPPAEPRMPEGIDWNGLAEALQTRRLKIRERLPGMVAVNASAIEVRQWLAWPHWTTNERAGYAGRMRDTGLEPVARALRTTPSEPSNVNVPPIDRAAFNGAALRRAKQAIDILVLAEDPEAANLERKYDAAVRQPDAVALRELGLAIERRWRDQLPLRYQNSNDPLERERIGWAVHPFDLPIRNSGDAATLDAAAHYRALRQRQHLKNLADGRDAPDAARFANIETDATDKLANALHALIREQQKTSRAKP